MSGSGCAVRTAASWPPCCCGPWRRRSDPAGRRARSPFTRIDFRAYAPTVEMTVYFRAALPAPEVGPEEFLLGVFSSKRAEGGFWEEDGELWTRDGRLLAQSRQLALVLPAGPK